MTHTVHTFTDLSGAQRVTNDPGDCDHCDLADPRVAAHVDLVAFGETPASAQRLLDDAERDPGRTILGEFAAVSYDDEPWRGKTTPYCAGRMPL